ncbi:MAG: T9SS type A sorting domain-containing protein [Rhodothermaceae bacterium]|nr:T9SS type A sorting domain-containing protein [Rhodothermaceae bacterium]
MPSKISLTQNYPNPFNPVTTVEFDLDRAQNVTLSVLDVTGRQVAVLVDDQKSAGTFRVQFDANYLPSGLYLYRLNTQTESLTRKMTLLK